MIRLVKREEVFRSNDLINSEIKKMQNVFYDPDMFEMYKEDGEENIYIEIFDALDTNISHKENEIVLGTNHSEISTFPKVLAKNIRKIYERLDIKHLVCISHLKMDYFGNRTNNFKPLQNAYGLLEEITNKESYKEAFKLTVEELDKMCEVLFWITRCDPSIPEYIFLFDEQNKTRISICKYGNIHYSEFKKTEINKSTIEDMGMLIIEGPEYDQFTNDGKIIGRELET